MWSHNWSRHARPQGVASQCIMKYVSKPRWTLFCSNCPLVQCVFCPFKGNRKFDNWKNITLAFVEPEYLDILFFADSLFSCPAPGSSTSNFGGGWHLRHLIRGMSDKKTKTKKGKRWKDKMAKRRKRRKDKEQKESLRLWQDSFALLRCFIFGNKLKTFFLSCAKGSD